ncbi:glycosyltransferase [Paenibacillus macerans]|uniref:glycosyltransferase n=1 Tax=Paenibacillus macerans TaxID=44252 RepID=UPI002E1DC460|nr:glycosyltransferase [Paenibacillus macerans]MED4954414.1 glycosyltransferase [Paenibacillus macerans]
MNIVIVTDDNYAQYAAVMLTSMYECTRHGKEIRLYVLYNKLSEKSIVNLSEIVEGYQSEIIFIEAVEDFLGYYEGSYVSRTAYLKMKISNYLPSTVNRVLYLDCDIIVQADIFQFENIDLANHYVAAVQDNNEKYARDLGVPVEKYFNSGVLLINIQKWREDNISDKAFSYVMSPQNKRNTCDQDALNFILWDKWLSLDRKFNYLLVNHEPVEDPIIIHYAAKDKPWQLLYSGEYKEIYKNFETICKWKEKERKDWDLLKSNSIFIYGASTAGQAAVDLLQQAGLDIVAFIDSDVQKQKIKVKGKPVHSIEFIKQMNNQCVIIVPSFTYYDEIRDNLFSFAFKPQKFCNRIFTKMTGNNS